MFDSTRWDHWLLVVVFAAFALYGLWQCWLWQKDAVWARRQNSLNRRIRATRQPGYRAERKSMRKR